MKKTLSLVFGFVFLSMAMRIDAQTTTITLGVGESYTLPAPTHYGATIYSAAWSSNSTNVTVQNLPGYQARITVVNAFTGNVRITCHFAYSWTDAQGYPHTGSNYAYYLVECSSSGGGGGGGGSGSGNETGVSLSPTSMTINVDDNFANYIGACALPSSAHTTFSWTTTNSSVATVSVYQDDGGCSNAYVDAHGVGTCYIRVTTANGYTQQCLVTVTSGSGGGGSGGGGSTSSTQFVVNGITYKKLNNTTCGVTYDSISGSTPAPTYSGVISIPSHVTSNEITYCVTAILPNAFRNCKNLDTIIIPNTVDSIGGGAFYGCESLSYITIPNGVSVINNYTFWGCKNLSSIIIPNSVTAIWHNAFEGCANLSSIIIPNSVTSLGIRAFFGCTSLTSVTIPASVTWTGSGMFSGCTSLSSIAVASNSTTLSAQDGILYNKNKTELICCPAGRSTPVIIPNTVTSISTDAFNGCINLTSITIPNTVTKVYWRAFYNCIGLGSLSVPNTVTVIKSDAFYEVKMVYYNGSATDQPWGAICLNGYIEDSLYYTSNAKTVLKTAHRFITNANIPNSVVAIGDSAFKECTNLVSVNIPSSVSTIGQKLFYNCSSLNSITIPNTISTVGNAAFSGCSSLSGVTIGNSVATIGSSAFKGCNSLVSVTIPNSVTSIGGAAFYGCSSLSNVTIGNSVVTIGSSAFEGCNSLVSVAIPNSVTSIGSAAFYGCSSLSNVTIGNSVVTIGSSSFNGCNSLVSLTIPNSVTWIGQNAFSTVNDNLIIYIMNPTPPSFGLTDCILSLVVPHQSYDNYYNAGINYSMHRIYSDTVFVIHQVNDTTRGYIVGDDTLFVFPYSDNINITSYAVPYYGYYFDKWENNSTDSVRNIINLTHDVTMKAFFEPNQYSIDVSVNNIQGGRIHLSYDSSSYEFIRDFRDFLDMFSMEAQPNYGYHFEEWSDGDTNNPRIITLTQDTSFTAIFAKNQYLLEVISSDTSMGVCIGNGTYDYLDTVEITAVGNAHYHFICWDDGNTANPRNVVVTGNRSYIATFAIDTHTVRVTSNDIARGMVESSGTEFVYGTPCTVTATAYTGYTFAGWSNGVTASPYIFAVLEDVELVALFVAESEVTYTVTVQSADPTMGTVSGGGMALDGGMVVIRATGNPGYRFLQWNDGNTDSVRTIVVHGNVTYTAYFEQSGGNENILDVTLLDVKTYQQDEQIVVEGAKGNMVWLYDVSGRLLAVRKDDVTPLRFEVPASGIYMIKIGNYPARKVVVIR